MATEPTQTHSRWNLARYLRPYRTAAILAPFFMVLEVAMDLAQPYLLQRIVDVGLAQMDLAVVLSTGLLMIALALVGAVGGIGCTVFAVRASVGFGADVRSALFRKVQSLSFGNLDRLGTGPLVIRLTNDVVQVQDVVMIALRVLVRSPLLFVGSLIMAVVTSPRLALILLVLSPFVIALLVWVMRRSRPLYAELQRRLDRLNTVIQENLAGVRLVKAFVRADYEQQQFGARNDSYMEQSIAGTRLVAVIMPAMMLTVNLGIAGVIWFGGNQVLRGDLQVGRIMAFVNYLLTTLFSLMMLSMLLIRLFRAIASADRIQEVLDSRPEIDGPANPVSAAVPKGRVAFEHVTFSYDGNAGEPVLCDVSFSVEPGQTVAILGATGSGKSSLVHLIPRFYDVTSGRVTIDGVDVRDLDKAALRKQVGIALQESVLFSGAIRDSIRYGRPDASDEEVIAAAQAAQAHEFIAQFPHGYDTVLGQRGVNVSGGQKQRIAIARALLTRPAVLILDDSTSSVDVETEARIQDALSESPAGYTSFVVAQRISTVLAADKILVLDQGALVAKGTHRKLLSSSSIYREIYESQLGDGPVDHVSG
ncbi:MAG: ABC transporter ATP-binding protein [Anaerolineae bacterium]|nr:ABC transporter ATP-binding protein [Anaerolineae bacterium]